MATFPSSVSPSALQLATRFTPSASLANAPEDVLVYIFAFVSPLDILSIRRCCRRLWHITNVRFIWLDALRKIFSSRHLPPLCPPTETKLLPDAFLEHRATRPLRFLHALADINSAMYHRTEFELDEDIALPPPPPPPPAPPAPQDNDNQQQQQAQPPPVVIADDPARGRPAVLEVLLVPGGRWLCLVVNRPMPLRAVLIVWDLWRDKAVVRHPFPDPAQWAHLRLDDDGWSSSVVAVVGFYRTQQHATDHYFAAYSVPIAQFNSVDKRVSRLGGLRVERTPRACSVFGTVLASLDRGGTVTFWDWKDRSSASMIIAALPVTKVKIMMMSAEYFASFNPASSAFAIHRVPPLLPLGVPDDLFDGDGDDGIDGFVQPPLIPGPTSHGVKRFRLPSRNLHVTVPNRVPASSFFTSNAEFTHSPFLAYFLVSHPDDMSELYMGVVPEINPEDEDEEDEDEEAAEDEEVADSDEAGGGNADVGAADDGQDTDDNNPQAAAAADPNPFAIPQAQAAAPQPGPADAPIPAAQLAQPQPAAVPPQGPEPEWLCTLRCLDTSSDTKFSAQGKIIWSSSLDHSIAVLRAGQGGRLELFTTTAMHSAPGTAQPPPRAPRPSTSTAANGNGSGNGMFMNLGWGTIPYSSAMVSAYFPLGLPPPPVPHHQPGPLPGIAQLLGAGETIDFSRRQLPVVGVPWPYNPRTFAAIANAAIPGPASASGSGSGGGGGDPGPSTLRARAAAVALDEDEDGDNGSGSSSPSRKRQKLSHNNHRANQSSTSSSSSSHSSSASPHPQRSTSSSPQPPGPTRSYYSPTTNPHPRMGLYAEGDYQVLEYVPPGEVLTATVDDVSGKIVLVVREGGGENQHQHVNVVVLDYGWDFWKTAANEEQVWYGLGQEDMSTADDDDADGDADDAVEEDGDADDRDEQMHADVSVAHGGGGGGGLGL